MSVKKTILVVEDDSDTRHLICTMIEKLGHQTLSFSRAQEALDSVAGKGINLALLDIMMPGMNGYELLAKLRAIDEYKDLPIIMITAKEGGSEIMDGYKYGADYYIPKPFNFEQLRYGIDMFFNPEFEE